MSGFYAVDWSGASTNIGIGLLAAVLGAALPAPVLAPLFLLAALVLPTRGVLAGQWRSGPAVPAPSGQRTRRTARTVSSPISVARGGASATKMPWAGLNPPLARA